MSTEKSRAEYRKNNKGYLKLDDDQCDMHLEVMSMNMSDWPPELQAYCQEQSKVYGFCGDAAACWVADWLRAGNKIVDPLAGESEDEEEAGRKAALEALARLKG